MTYQKQVFKKRVYQTEEEARQKRENRINAILQQFKDKNPSELSGDVAYTYVTRLGYPCEKMSLLNQLIIDANNTEDARTYLAWQKVGRKVITGRKAFYVWKPIPRRVKSVKPEAKNKPEDKRTESDYTMINLPPIFYTLQPEFRYEDTEGLPVVVNNKPKDLPPLLEVAEKINCPVSWKRMMQNQGYYGYFQPSTNKIVLSAENWNLYFHELAHAVHCFIDKIDLKNSTKTKKETIAEFVACVISDIYGIDTKKHTMEYILYNNDFDKEKMMKELSQNMHLIETILDTIFELERKPASEDQ